jgi:predicted AlkP superfamily pyrophosphatase or phosphodiesterase
MMLPKAPKDVGRLSDVFTSALASVGGGGENRLRLPKVKHAIVILVDGLGFENLTQNKAYARFMNSKLVGSLRCEFPSTTSTSLTGLATGLRSGQHGVIGYSVYSRQLGTQRNLLTGWLNRGEASEFKKAEDLSSSAKTTTSVIGPEQYAATGFTELTMSGANYVTAESLADRFAAALQISSQDSSSLTYLYVPELDQLAHRFGVESTKWLEALEALDAEISVFETKLSQNSGVILTADHGVLDVPSEHHVYLDEFKRFTDFVIASAGDPRCNFLYLNEGVDSEEFSSWLNDEFGHLAYVCTQGVLEDSGWVTSPSVAIEDYVPDVYLIWHKDYVGYDRRTAKPHHLKLIGQHGSITDRETRIPLVRFGAF